MSMRDFERWLHVVFPTDRVMRFATVMFILNLTGIVTVLLLMAWSGR